jgi:hypothetical protein
MFAPASSRNPRQAKAAPCGRSQGWRAARCAHAKKEKRAASLQPEFREETSAEADNIISR